MKITDIIGEAAGVGRVVKGVNTSPDVHPGEIQRQAAKFKLTVDKNGRPPIASTNGKEVAEESLTESINGREMWRVFTTQHHSGIDNPKMENWIKNNNWGLKTVHPTEINDLYADDLPDDPFNRIIDLDPDRVNWYKRKLEHGQRLQPIILGPNGSVIDGNHRAAAAQELGQSITAFVPMNIDN